MLIWPPKCNRCPFDVWYCWIIKHLDSQDFCFEFLLAPMWTSQAGWPPLFKGPPILWRSANLKASGSSNCLFLPFWTLCPASRLHVLCLPHCQKQSCVFGLFLSGVGLTFFAAGPSPPHVAHKLLFAGVGVNGNVYLFVPWHCTTKNDPLVWGLYTSHEIS